MLVAIIVGFLYGGTVIFGVLPSVGSHISWDGHLCGAIAGGALGYFQSREPKGETITDSGELQ